MNASETKKAKEIVDSFLEKLGVSANAKVFVIEEYLKVEIEGNDTSLLIGYHGDNLRALRHLLSIMLRKHIAEDTIVMVDVAGYIADKEKRIQRMAQEAIDNFKKTEKPQALPQMTSFERRIAHSYITDQGFSSESEGEDRDRHIVVSA